MAGTNVLCTDYWLGQNFTLNPGYSIGTDNNRMMPISEILTKYSVTISNMTLTNRYPIQTEIIVKTFVMYITLTTNSPDALGEMIVSINGTQVIDFTFDQSNERVLHNGDVISVTLTGPALYMTTSTISISTNSNNIFNNSSPKDYNSSSSYSFTYDRNGMGQDITILGTINI